MKYYCTNCGTEFLKWSGKCSFCNEWDTLQEQDDSKDTTSNNESIPASFVKLGQYKESKDSKRISSGFKEFDRVLGGGIVLGSIILLTGQPGIGKSTLLSQISTYLSDKLNVLYVSGEESVGQLYSRLKRISSTTSYSNLTVSEESGIEKIEALIEKIKPDLVIVDSIQSLSSKSVRSFSGSIGQVRVCGAILTKIAKTNSIPIIVIGQINKDGNVAGPKVLEHIVDTVLSFEGGEYSQYRVLRALKNRFGSTEEIGVFEMSQNGMLEISNPSEAFVEGQNLNVGSSLGAVLKGSRVVFVEVQALVTEKGGDLVPAKRMASGIKKNRLDMLCAVLSKNSGIYLWDKDVYINIVGGVDIDDPSIDLSVCKSIISSYKNEKVPLNTVYFGEVGLNGEVRKNFTGKIVSKEVKRLGYKVSSVL